MKLLDLLLFALVLGGAVCGAYGDQFGDLRTEAYMLLLFLILAFSVACAAAWWVTLATKQTLDPCKLVAAIRERSTLLAFYVPLRQDKMLLDAAPNQRSVRALSNAFQESVLGVGLLFAGILLIYGLAPEIPSSAGGRLSAVLDSAWGRPTSHAVATFLACWSFSYFLLSKLAQFKKG